MEGNRVLGIAQTSIASLNLSRNSEALQSMIQRVSLSNTHSPALPHTHPSIHSMGAASNYSSPGSRVNYNNPPHNHCLGTSQASPFKPYEDKFIPGAKLVPQSSQQPSSPAYSPNSPAYSPSSPGYPSNSPTYSHNNSVVPTQHNSRHCPAPASGVPSPPFMHSASNYADNQTHLMRPIAGSNSSLSQNSSLQSTQSEAEQVMSVKTAFTYKELVTATNGFSEANILGEGGFGVVYKGQLGSIDCAVKKFCKRKDEKGKDSKDQILSELTALSKYQHKNMVTLYGYALDGPDLCLVYEYLSKGSLEDRLMRKNNTPALSWERRLNILVGSCRALDFLHTLGSAALIHGDIKSANILLDQNLEAKFADLGQSRYATSRSATTGTLTHITQEQTATREYGTRAYFAPEIVRGSRLSVQSDIYAMGVVILEVCSGLQAYDFHKHVNNLLTEYYFKQIAKLDEQDRVKIFQDRGPEDYIGPTTFSSLLKTAELCLKDRLKNRPTAGELLQKVTDIYQQQNKERSLPKSLNAPTEDDVSNISALSNYHSHLSEFDYGDQLNSPAPQPSSTFRLQDERYMQLVNQRQNSSQYSPTSKTTPPDFAKSTTGQSSNKDSCQKDSDSKLPQSTFSDKVSVSPEVHLSSVTPKFLSNRPIPEAYRLQAHYDQLSNPNQGSPLGSSLNRSEERRLTTEYASDPKKLSAINEFDQRLGFQTSDCRQSLTNGIDSSSEFLKCDEAKLAYLKNFDDNAFCSKKANNSFTTSPERILSMVKTEGVEGSCQTNSTGGHSSQCKTNEGIEVRNRNELGENCRAGGVVQADKQNIPPSLESNDRVSNEEKVHNLSNDVGDRSTNQTGVDCSGNNAVNEEIRSDIDNRTPSVQGQSGDGIQKLLNNRENLFSSYQTSCADDDEDDDSFDDDGGGGEDFDEGQGLNIDGSVGVQMQSNGTSSVLRYTSNSPERAVFL